VRCKGAWITPPSSRPSSWSYRSRDALASAQGGVPLAWSACIARSAAGWQLREGQDLLPAATRKEMEARTYWGGLPDSGARLPEVEEDPQGNPGESHDP
jgi:hypothetical protein